MLGSPLIAEAAFATGASLVLLGFPQGLKETYQKILPENMLCPLPETPASSLSLEAEQKILELAKEVDTVVLGEGLSKNSETGQLIQKIAPQIPAILVLEKDGLFHISPSLFSKRENPTIILPDSSEMAALLQKENFKTPDKRPIMEGLYKHRETIAKEAAKRWQVILILKGHQIIVSDGERAVVALPNNDNQFLTGILATLAAQNKTELFKAAATAVYLQSKAKSIKELPEIISQSIV